MITVACHQRHLAVGRECDMARPGLRISEIDLAGRGQRLVGDGEDRHGTVVAICNQRQSACRIDREPRRGGARFDGRDHRRRLGFQIDDRDLIIGCVFFRIGRVELDRAGHQRDAFVPGYGDALWRTDDARWSLQLGNHFRRFRREVDDGHGVRRRIVRNCSDAVDEDGLVVVRGYGDLRGSSDV